MRISPPVATSHDPALARTKKAATEFEAQLLNSLLDAGGVGLMGLPGADSAEAGSYGSLAREALSSALAARGGIGFSRMILNSLSNSAGRVRP